LITLCKRFGPLTKTKAVKLPYLVDVVANHVLGRPITEGTHQTWEHGVVTREVYAALTHNVEATPFVAEPHPFSESGDSIRLDDSTAESSGTLSPEEAEVVDWVGRRYGKLDAVRLGLLTKALNTQHDPSVWGSNHAAHVDEGAYARLADGWQRFFERIPSLDLRDRSQWRTIDDPHAYFKEALGE